MLTSNPERDVCSTARYYCVCCRLSLMYSSLYLLNDQSYYNVALTISYIGSVPQPSRPTYSKRGGNFVTLTWGESFCDGGRKISNFMIRYRRSSYYYSSYSYITISNPAQRSYPVRGLSSSTTYRFGILATAIDGTTSSYTSDVYITTLPSRKKVIINIIMGSVDSINMDGPDIHNNYHHLT